MFLPSFVRAIAAMGVRVFLEDGYGEELGINPAEYASDCSGIAFVDRSATWRADLVIVLRAPEREEFDLLKRGACLVSMLHFPTRSWRVDRLMAGGVNAVAMDQITDDNGNRVVENLHSVAWNGLEAGFDLLESTLPGLSHPDGSALSVVVLGSGKVGQYAVDAAVKYGSLERRERLMAGGHPGVVCSVLGRSGTGRPATLRRALSACDILVDATQRSDPSRSVVSNEELGLLPRHAVIVDLAVDPYLLDDNPPVVRSIEGIPRGNLDHYVFPPDDPDWSRTVPSAVSSANRRHVVSCYSWPGVHPRSCMEHYGRQLLPVVQALVRVGYAGLSATGDAAVRAAWRGSLAAYLAGGRPEERILSTSSVGTGGDE